METNLASKDSHWVFVNEVRKDLIYVNLLSYINCTLINLCLHAVIDYFCSWQPEMYYNIQTYSGIYANQAPTKICVKQNLTETIPNLHNWFRILGCNSFNRYKFYRYLILAGLILICT